MLTLKQKAIKTISKLSDNANLDDIMYQLYLLEKIRKGEDDISNGNTITTENLVKEAKAW